MSYCDTNDNVKYIVTSKIMRDVYYLYEVGKDMEIKKLGQNQNPLDLEKKIKL